jgi:hypothetical protein
MESNHVDNNDRRYWLEVLESVATPVLSALAEGRLKSSMPVESRGKSDRAEYSHLEALGRLLAGIAPWLELDSCAGEEEILRVRFAEQARAGIAAAVDPASPDYMNFSRGMQPVVDASFLAIAVLRAPRELWEKLDDQTKQNMVLAFESTRVILPVYNNWLLFSAAIEVALLRMGQTWDRMRVDYAIRQHEQWYVGDGAYSDGPNFHWDYYNSFVIQPYLADILMHTRDKPTWQPFHAPILQRLQRYAAVLERMVSPEGTIPPIGRSLAYRCGALHALAHAALYENLPLTLSPAGVRCAMTVVIRRTMQAPGTFDENGWLRIGFCGTQPGLGETYISTGSLYACAWALLPLGLPATHAFWAGPPEKWTSQRIYDGDDMPADKAF